MYYIYCQFYEISIDMKPQESILTDLKSLWQCNKVLRAEQLNEKLGGKKISENVIPRLFTGNPEAKTIMIMFNPGYEDKIYDFVKQDKSKYQNFESFLEIQLKGYRNYGEDHIKEKVDTFDVKQAAFLYKFEDTALQIPYEFWKTLDMKRQAKRNVLMNKYQLELIPYCSVDIKGLLVNPNQARKTFHAFEPFLTDVLEAIFENKRKFVVFCYSRFSNLFIAASGHDSWKNVFTFTDYQTTQDNGAKYRCSKVIINYKGENLTAIIAHSLMNRSFSYENLIRYGEFCLKVLNKN